MRDQIVAVALVSAVLSAGAAGANEDITDQLALARICVSEAGFPQRDRRDADEDGDTEEWLITDDCAAIHEVLTRGAQRHRMRFQTFARAYSTRVFNPRREDTRAYVANLTPAGGRPSGWPTDIWVRTSRGLERRSHAPWGQYRDAWLALYEHAGQVISGEIGTPCEEDAHHWGGSMDTHRAVRAGWLELDCGNTRNTFWQVPALAR
jgi:hypothetical protein